MSSSAKWQDSHQRPLTAVIKINVSVENFVADLDSKEPIWTWEGGLAAGTEGLGLWSYMLKSAFN